MQHSTAGELDVCVSLLISDTTSDGGLWHARTLSLFATNEEPVSVMSTMPPTPGKLAFTCLRMQQIHISSWLTRSREASAVGMYDGTDQEP